MDFNNLIFTEIEPGIGLITLFIAEGRGFHPGRRNIAHRPQG